METFILLAFSPPFILVPNRGGGPCLHFTDEALARLNDLSMVTPLGRDDGSQGGTQALELRPELRPDLARAASC